MFWGHEQNGKDSNETTKGSQKDDGRTGELGNWSGIQTACSVIKYPRSQYYWNSWNLSGTIATIYQSSLAMKLSTVLYIGRKL